MIKITKNLKDNYLIFKMRFLNLKLKIKNKKKIKTNQKNELIY